MDDHDTVCQRQDLIHLGRDHNNSHAAVRKLTDQVIDLLVTAGKILDQCFS